MSGGVRDTRSPSPPNTSRRVWCAASVALSVEVRLSNSRLGLSGSGLRGGRRSYFRLGENTIFVLRLDVVKLRFTPLLIFKVRISLLATRSDTHRHSLGRANARDADPTPSQGHEMIHTRVCEGYLSHPRPPAMRASERLRLHAL